MPTSRGSAWGASRTAVVFLADQVVVSGTRFVVGWTLARFTPPENYGAYTLVLSLLFVLDVAQQALVTWPLAVIGAAKQGDAFRRYVRTLAGVQAWAAAGSAALALCAALAMPPAWFGGRPGAHALGAALLVAAQQAQEFCRRVLLTRRPAGALVNDALLALVVVGALLASAVHASSWLASEWTIVLYGLGAAAAAVVGWIQIRDLRAPAGEGAREALRESWGFGRFIVGSRLGESLLSHGQNFVLGAVAGAAGVGALQATRLLVSPLQVAALAALNFVLPRGTERLQSGGPPALDRLVLWCTAAFTAGSAIYGLVLSARPSLWLGLAYGGRYDDPLLLRLCCALQVVAAARLLLSAALYVRRRSDVIMSAVLTCGAGSTALSVALGRAWGPVGVAGAILAGEVVLAAWIVMRTRRAAAADARPTALPEPP